MFGRVVCPLDNACSIYTCFLQLSMALSTAFGQDTEGSEWVVTYLLDKICYNLDSWSSEESLINDTLKVLQALVEHKERY